MANPEKKCHPCLVQKPRKTLCVRPQGSIPTFFFTGKWKSLLWLLWRFPVVFSYFMTWWKAPLLFLRHKDENKRNVGEIFFWRVSHVCCCCLFKKCDTRVLKEDFQRYDKHVDLTHLTSSVSSTLGNMMAGGRTAACRMTCRSASAKPLDTEFTLTHFSVRPKSSSANILGIVSRASVCKKTRHTGANFGQN